MLLAKSVLTRKDGTDDTLSVWQHLAETDQAARAIFAKDERQVENFLRFFRLSTSDKDDFFRMLRVAALAHDIGKANEDFQKAVTSKEFYEQAYRHEHLSALYLSVPEIRAWLGTRVDADIVTAAVLTHHLKVGVRGAGGAAGRYDLLPAGRRGGVKLHLDDSDIVKAMSAIAKVAGIKEPVPLALPARTYSHPAWQDTLSTMITNASTFRDGCSRDSRRWKLHLAVKAALVCADSVASGLWRSDLKIDEWVKGTLHSPALSSPVIEEDVFTSYREKIGTRWKGFRHFQTNAGSVGRRGLLLAATGTGKTLAAWHWARDRVDIDKVGRVIFLYPTRDTATEGFKDYLANTEGSTLLHSTSDFELLGVKHNTKVPSKEETEEAKQRLFALEHWDKKFFSATVDQFLSFTSNGYRSTVLLPVLADAAVIIDEVHSFDDVMWKSLMAFLAWFDLPVLCMTASLPPARKQELVAAGLAVYPRAEDREDLADLEAHESAPRYKLTSLPAQDQKLVELALKRYRENKKVLWVANTVARCQSITLALHQALEGDEEVVCYHSKFIVRDRRRIRDQVVACFKHDAKKGVLAVTTQVCEMSLDLDADTLISEQAPVSSLVQRFGRCNRHLTEGRIGELITYSSSESIPYQTSELVQANGFLNYLASMEVFSQKDLAAYLASIAADHLDTEPNSSFTEGGYYALGKPFRDFDGGVAAVLSRDVDVVEELCKKKDAKKEEYVITVPEKVAKPTGRPAIPKYIHVAPAEQYSYWLGFVSDDALLALAAPFLWRPEG